MKLYLDPGHGGSDPGAQGNGLNEKDLTLDIALKIRFILTNSYENIEVMMSRTTDVSKSLSQRTNEANNWGADYYLAIHINAADGSAQGYEDYIYSKLSDSSTTAIYQGIIHGEVIKMNQLKDRGRKKANFHVLRESAMPAFLSENGFIDNTHDAALLKQASWRQNVAQGHANGIAIAFNLKSKPPVPTDPGTGTLYKVIAGSFQSRENADERVAYLQSKRIDAFVNPTTISGKTWYRVQAGAYSNRANAEKRLEEVKKAGIADPFLVAEH
ncbi:N-acetylmuramoyl-L-alanine amidase [Neobacillus sp. WH10]|uniref:N-acetylmuramoyl-L-alanine amidase n=1 Tax=Neobacillus sp. WH10 TaxID=3047873 RepID=UPI0024C15819|nr:N-acetylmuramoyl-L-alanine amidase [Neobacillus sp. WH10]WHY76989.1 N-acetylmuramoyl-L-alanine amidase [Neobacillus sp. WH10]